MVHSFLMNIKTFEQEIEQKILGRGFHYYEQDYINDLEQVEKGEFCATVSGSEVFLYIFN